MAWLKPRLFGLALLGLLLVAGYKEWLTLTY